MLRSLLIKNYALLARIQAEFGPGLNILTGETGAGKSIIIDALGTILGDRVDTGTIGQDGDKAVIEGEFDTTGNAPLISYLTEADLASPDHALILRREILGSGRSRAFVNDSPVQLAVLQQISDLLIDLHGQHEHQSLLQTQHHLGFIDSYGGLADEVHEVSEAFEKLARAKRELAELAREQTSWQEKREALKLKIEEIDRIEPQADEEEALLAEEKIVRNSEKLFSLTNELFTRLYEQENSAYDTLSRVFTGMQELEQIDAAFAKVREDCGQARLLIEEVAKFLQGYKSGLDFSPQRLEEIQTRISELAGLRKRFGRSIPEVIKLRRELLEQIRGMENLDERIEALQSEVQAQTAVFSELCLNLSEKRKKVASTLEQKVPEILAYLGIPQSRFNVALQYHDDPSGDVLIDDKAYLGTRNGMDFADFLISLNKGQSVRPLVKVASGGEISRIMLALKSIIAEKGRIPVLVFDEIDSGVSGRIARAVGRKLDELAHHHQIICITHLPQIASLGEHHFSVEKEERNGKTRTVIRKLVKHERAQEIAKLLAGEHVTEAHLNSARELLDGRVPE